MSGRLTASKFVAAASIGLFAGGSASAITSCIDCEYVTGSPATYLGSTAPGPGNFFSFRNSSLGTELAPGTSFTDYWVFDVDNQFGFYTSGYGQIAGLIVALFADKKSECTGVAGSACASLDYKKKAIAEGQIGGAGLTSYWQINGSVNSNYPYFLNLDPGRYILQITGAVTGSASAYRGSIGVQVPEPGTLALLSLGLLGLGFTARRRLH